MAKKKVRVELKPGGISEFLFSRAVEQAAVERGEAMNGAAGPGHKVSVLRGHDRVHVIVSTDSHEAKVAEAEDRNLSQSIDAARY